MKVQLPSPLESHPSHEIIDSTKLQTFQDCPRQFFFEYVLGWKTDRPSNHLVFGSAVHLALEHLILNGYRVQTVTEALQIFNDEYREIFPEETDQLYSPKTPGRFMEMLVLYVQKYASDLNEYRVYKTEFGGTVHLSPDHRLAFKMDTILQNIETGNYLSLEHKTKGGNYIDKSYHIDHMMGVQVGTYTHVLNCLFEPTVVDGVIINCMCFKKTKNPDFILERFPVFLTNDQMYIWMENTKNWIDHLQKEFEILSEDSVDADHMKAFPCNGRSCSNWGRVCQYQPLCSSWSNPLQHTSHRPLDMKVEFWNPLEEDLREVLEL
jgi:hypothetical protein